MFARSESHFRPDNPPGEHRTSESTGQTGDAELFGLLSRLGGISFNNGLYRAMDQGITRLAGQFIDTAFSARPSRARPFAYDWLGRVFALDSGTKTIGVEATAETPKATFGSATSVDCRATFFKAHPELEGRVIVHHAIPQKALILYPNEITQAQIQSLENLRGIPKDANAEVHLSQIANEWNQFYKANPNATRAQLLQKATEIDAKYGSQFLPPRGGRQ